jgi:lipoprotein NlpD
MSGCAASGPREVSTYVVRPQDTLYSIAWRHDLDYRDLARWNNIGADYRLAVGQVLVLQGGHARPPAAAPERVAAPERAAVPARAGAAVPRVGKPAPLTGSGASPQPPPAAKARVPEPVAKAPAPAVVGGAKWMWPTERRAAPRPVPGGGVLLFGQLGQDVRAASTGRVVYVGNGIRGYGNLVIIKHGETLLSSYAHNRETLVKEGQDVLIGQTIAHMGTGPHQTSVLYFEIRANGKPVDPLPYLPK